MVDMALVPLCHTQFLSQNRILIVCVLRNQVYTHTIQKWIQNNQCDNV
jgi:hypothetical protein